MFLESELEKEDGTEIMINECIRIVKDSKGVIIFGAGVGGKALYNLLSINKLIDKIICFSDNNELKFGKAYCNEQLSVEPPCDLMSKFGRGGVIIIVASSAYDIIKKQLLSYGYDAEQIYLFNFAFMDLEYTDRNFIYSHIEDFKRAYEKMADDKSRRIFKNILNYKITKKNKYLEQMQIDVDDEYYQYFANDLFEFCKDEVFLDIGAYTGDTLEKYDKIYREWKGYIGLEADKVVYEKLNEFISNHNFNGKSQTYNIAAWNKKERLFFSENPGSSSVKIEKNDGMLGVDGDKVDNVLINDVVTFIKMDIEGAEFYAISGMKNLIIKNKPILAVCVYHLRDDFFKLTDLIESIVPNEYTYYFRQYRYTPTETVCYAVPKGRLKT